MSATPSPTKPPTAAWGALWPRRLLVDAAERWHMVAGALVGILVTSALCHALGGVGRLGWIVAPMGASAVLLFCVPGSPLAQPWSVVGGSIVSAIVGIACTRWCGQADLAAAAAVSLAIATMLSLRCLHPPGGAVALLMVVTGTTDPLAAAYPVALNAVLLTAAAWLFHRATGKHRYPHVPQPVATTQGITEEDLDVVLAGYNEVLDISRDDLLMLVDRTQRLAHERQLAHTRCEDVMTREVHTVEYGTSLVEAWMLLRRHKLKTLPVIDRGRHVVGIVTLTDFIEAAAGEALPGLVGRLERLFAPSGRTHGDKPEVVGQIMTRKVRVTRPHRTLSDLVALFDSTGHRHIPVIGEGGKLVGMVTQSDVMAALKLGRKEAAAGA